MREILNGLAGWRRHNIERDTIKDIAGAAGEIGRALATEDLVAPVPKHDPTSAPIDVVDVFCGCGGLSAGFRLLSQFIPAFRLAGALDWDENAVETYRRNLGLSPIVADAHAVANKSAPWIDFERRLNLNRGNVTCVVGGPPCQGFSSHRRTIDDCDHLNRLFIDFAKIAVRLNPAVIVMENVPELVTVRSWPFYVQASKILKDAGYTVRTRVYNLAGFGLPQERFRCLTVAMRKQFAMPEPFLDRRHFRTVRAAIGMLPPVVPGKPHERDPEHWTAGHRPSTISTIAAVPKNGGRRPLELGPECLRRIASTYGRTGYDDVYGRLWWDRPSVTITGSARNPASGRFVHPEQDRGLSIREAARIQGFPITYRFTGSFDSRFTQIGNAIPPTVAAHLASHLLAELITPRRSAPPGSDIRAPLGTSFSRLIAGIKRGAIKI